MGRREDHDEHADPPVQDVQLLQAANGTFDWTDPARQHEVRCPRCDAEERGEVGDALQYRESAEPVRQRSHQQPGESRE